MTIAAVLFGYALVLGTAGGAVLRRARWVDRAPRLGIAAWQALSASLLMAVILGGAALVVPTVSIGSDLAALLEACVFALQAQYATTGGAAVSGSGAALALGVMGRAGYCLARALLVGRRERRRQYDMLTLVGRPDPRVGALVVEHDVAAAYCLPGRGRHIVLTSGALAALGPDQLQAVLAHERSHLHGRHHVVLAGTLGLVEAFPYARVFQHAHTEVARLVEMLADDAAARRCDRLTVASALVALAEGAAPAAALAAGGPTAVARMRRLVAPAQPLGLLGATLGGFAVAAALVVPVAVAAAPAVSAAQQNYCPVSPAVPNGPVAFAA